MLHCFHDIFEKYWFKIFCEIKFSVYIFHHTINCVRSLYFVVFITFNKLYLLNQKHKQALAADNVYITMGTALLIRGPD